MTTDWLSDVVSVLDGLEEILEVVSGDGRLLSYARDLTRLVGWIRVQPRARVLVLGALGAGLVVGAVLLSNHGQAPQTRQPRTWPELPVTEPDPEEDWR